ncbi:hypothetical protein L3X38_022077 [Prunus dulcis]|uniref:NAD(P)-binding domain-containing protein n=1 Tax=Prunus dulcis TaxID=3755 RepID=A0AAD4VVB8_PRUDU|nr:hypothetical protein L3X38_022077 [Prunus dulcis]
MKLQSHSHSAMACNDSRLFRLGGQEISRNPPLPLTLRKPPRRLCTVQCSHSNHSLPYPPSLSIIKSTSKVFSAISNSLPNIMSFLTSDSTKMEGSDFTEEVTEATEIYINAIGKKKIFVAGATGSTGKRIVERLLAKGFRVKAGVRDLDKAKTSLPQDNPALQIVKADVTEGSAKLADAISDDSEAVICATGCRSGWDLYAPWKVDNLGTVNLVDACRKLGVKRFILVSSLLVNGAAMGQILNPAYIFLNVFGLNLIAKLRAEDYIRESGMNYTIIRPGGLRNEPPTGNLVMEPEDTLYEGTISRDQVAEVAIEALVRPQASYKVVEIVARADAPKRSYGDLFSSITQR